MRAPPDVLRVKGLIVEDSLDRARIVIGAPMPLDGTEANAGGEGIAILSPEGRFRVAIGAPTPAPVIAGEVAERGPGDSAGLIIYDGDGDERGGMGTFADGPVELEEGARFTITTRDVAGTAEICGTTYDGLPGDVGADDQILIDDGKINDGSLRRVLIHAIAADEVMQKLSVMSKLNADWEFLTHLRDDGRDHAGRWLDQTFDRLGKQSTIDIREAYL